MEITREIDKHLLVSIQQAYNEAKESVANAKTSIHTAIEKSARVGAEIEKAKEIHKQDLFGFMDQIMPASEVKDFLAVYDIYKKRGISMEERMLKKTHIKPTAEKQENLIDVTHTAQQSLIGTATSFIGRINKIVERRPVQIWNVSEREQVKDVLRPLYELYNTL